MSKFTHLHVHSHYSLLDGLPKIDELLDYVKKLGMDSVAITDHGVLYSAVEFFKKAKKKGVKAIIGCEAYTAFESMHQKRPHIDNRIYHLILLVKNETGYKNLVKLLTKAHLEGFYYKPRIDDELLAKHSKGLIGLSACLKGKIPQLILQNKIEEAKETALKYKKIFDNDSFYLEIQDHPNIEKQKKVNEVLISFSKELKIPLVATNDAHYLRSEDADAQDTLMLINTGADPNDPERLTIKADDFSLTKPEQIIEEFKDTPEAIENTLKIAEQCNFEFKLGQIRLPEFKTPNNETVEQYLEKLCKKGLKKKYGALPKKEVTDRLNYELEMINKMGFSSYFLIVQDFVNWAKEKRIVVGPGRGSVGGSLVSYLLNITSIDPLKYELLFERFLNVGRNELPDIDLDFTDRRRSEVIEYVTEKYGKDRVAQIITFGTMAARAVIRDVGRALSYPYSYCDQIAKMIPFGHNLEETLAKIPEFRQLYETDIKAEKLINLAKKLEGVARHASTHACGIVISAKPLDNIIPLQHPTQNKNEIITQYEMHAVEDLGLLKMDFLGLKNLTIIEDTLARIYAIHKKKIDIENLPLNDRQTYKLLQKGKTVGVFQMESGGFQRYLKQLKPDEFEDIIVMIALYRPGPIALIPEYIARKQNKSRVEYIHPKLKEILKKTYGLPVYQEDLMFIAQRLAGFSLSEADILRKAIGKKIEKLLLEQKQKLIKGMKENGIEDGVARKIWEWILPFARYGFNRSHSAAYATIAYQTAYLKTHYPVEFMSALLTSEKSDVERIGFLIDECKKMGIEVLPPDINESWRNFGVIPHKKQMRFGLFAIKNVGEGIVNTIVNERKSNGPFQSINDFILRISSKDLNKKSLESLIKAGVFDRFAERNQLLHNLERFLSWNRENQKIRANGQIGLFDGTQTATVKIRLEATEAASKREKLSWEKELLGLFVSSHPLEDYKAILEKKSVQIASLGTSTSRRRVRIGGIISKIKKIITKTGKPMIFMNLEDLSDKIEVVVFPSMIEKEPTLFKENKIVFVSGRLDSSRSITPKLICEDIEEIIEV
ncbi:MAG TPA: DNA polymerase III subunit alpha [bacterium]|nr:DNA polymerase III subunit alpha [bacterium]